MMKAPDISVMIPTFNRKNILEMCLNAYGNQTFPQDRFEVIVVDDGSTDGTEKAITGIIRNMDFPICYFRKKNGGPGSARNLGIPKSSGKILVITGDDIIPDENLLREHWEWHTKRFPEHNIGIMGMVTWMPDPPPSPFMRWLEQGVQFAYHMLKHEREVPWTSLYTSNISFKKQFLEETGERFDERLLYHEDAEWGNRLAGKGLKLFFNQHALGLHSHYTTLYDSLLRMEKIGKSERQLMQLNPEVFHQLTNGLFTSTHRWKRQILRIFLNPILIIPFVLPLARFLEHRGIVSPVYALAHQYYYFKGFQDVPCSGTV